jgi:hypothetical protein
LGLNEIDPMFLLVRFAFFVVEFKVHRYIIIIPFLSLCQITPKVPFPDSGCFCVMKPSERRSITPSVEAKDGIQLVPEMPP